MDLYLTRSKHEDAFGAARVELTKHGVPRQAEATWALGLGFFTECAVVENIKHIVVNAVGVESLNRSVIQVDAIVDHNGPSRISRAVIKAERREGQR